MRLARRLLLAFGLALYVASGTAYAACGAGQTMTYEDITLVWFVRNGCLTPTEPGMPPTFECSRFSLLVDGAHSTYSARNVPGEVDLFASSIKLADLKAILSGSHFFDIDFGDYAPNGHDTTLISVLRCSKVSIMSLYDWRGLSDPRASTITDQILQLTKASTKTKIPGPR